eukprot:scaffold361_cov248-Pinguiococcus_pyrenoidosus.AAC.2
MDDVCKRTEPLKTTQTQVFLKGRNGCQRARGSVLSAILDFSVVVSPAPPLSAKAEWTASSRLPYSVRRATWKQGGAYVHGPAEVQKHRPAALHDTSADATGSGLTEAVGVAQQNGRLLSRTAQSIWSHYRAEETGVDGCFCALLNTCSLVWRQKRGGQMTKTKREDRLLECSGAPRDSGSSAEKRLYSVFPAKNTSAPPCTPSAPRVDAVASRRAYSTRSFSSDVVPGIFLSCSLILVSTGGAVGSCAKAAILVRFVARSLLEARSNCQSPKPRSKKP